MVKFVRFFILFILICNQNFSQVRDSLPFYEIEELPEFDSDLSKFIQDNLNYPQTAINDSISGIVYVKFIINEQGATINHKILKGVREDLDNEALRIAKSIVFKKPAMNKGKSVQIEFILPVDFNLKKKK